MPTLKPEVIGHCPHCKLRMALNDDGTTPHHIVGIFVCEGIGQPGLPEKPAGKRKRK